MDLSRKVQVKKLEAAQRQLDCAIWLWFSNGDEISIHTLACAAHQIINDIHEGKNIGHKLVFGSDAIKKDKRVEFVRELKKSVNFFKHADKDPGGILDFMPGFTEGFLMTGVIGLFNLEVQPTHIERTFYAWEVLHNPEFFENLPQLIERQVPPDAMSAAREASKADFYNVFMGGLLNMDHEPLKSRSENS